jgi:hypothetical protein
MAVTCFMLEPAGWVQVGLRRFVRDDAACPREGGKWSYHGALLVLGDAPIAWSAEQPDRRAHWFKDPEGGYGTPRFEYPGRDDPRWPARCECGHEFAPDDPRQEWSGLLYRRFDNDELVTLRDAPPGAMWDAPWYPWKGPDGLSLMVKCPNGDEWCIDSRASNCTMPEDTGHRCWIRHGEPPRITVDKAGLTCNAGAGSIQAGDYRGFLRDGVFT